MSLSRDDLAYKGLTHATAAATEIAGPCRLMGWTVTGGGAADGVLSIFNATGTGGTADLVVRAATNTTHSENYGPNGVRFDTSLSVTIAGTGATFAVFYIEE